MGGTGTGAPGSSAGEARGLRLRVPGTVVGLLAAAVLLLPMSGGMGSFNCADCGSHLSRRKFHWGIGRPWITFWRGETVRPSRVAREFFSEGHEHRWPLGNTRVEGVFRWNTLISGGFVSCGVLVPNGFSRACEDSEEFLGRVKSLIAAGEISPEEVRTLCGLPDGWRLHRIASVPAGSYALVRRANRWLEEARRDPLWEEGRDWPPEAGG